MDPIIDANTPKTEPNTPATIPIAPPIKPKKRPKKPPMIPIQTGKVKMAMMTRTTDEVFIGRRDG
jgi:hypothetical protein